MFNLVPTPDILEEGIRLLGAHKYCTASSVLPFQANFFHILEFDRDDVIYFVLPLFYRLLAFESLAFAVIGIFTV